MTLNDVPIPDEYIILPFQKHWQVAAIGMDGQTRSFRVPFDAPAADIELWLRVMVKSLERAGGVQDMQFNRELERVAANVSAAVSGVEARMGE